MKTIYRLSDSSLNVLHTCERMYQLDRIARQNKTEKEHYPATVLGNSFEAGVSSYIQFQDLDKALYAAWLAYWPIKEDEKRTTEVALNMVKCAVPHLNNLLNEWELVYFQGKPAVQLSFRINIDELFHYVGYVDFILRNRFTGKYMVFDSKTTALNLLDLSPIYQNSNQCISYSVTLDAIVGEDLSEYDVAYFSGKLGSGDGFSPVIKPYVFTKNLSDRLDWFISLGMDVNHIKEMLQLGIFPRRGDSCLQYNKPCRHFGACHLHTFDDVDDKEEEEEKYQFNFELEELIKSHIERIERMN